MKPKLLVGIIIFLFNSSVLIAQDDGNFENTINQQFGTLLETLIKDGKISEHNAKIYLDAVFGYDESVSNYLQNATIMDKIGNLNQGKASFTDYLAQLNTSLLNTVPQNYKQELLKNPNYLGWQLGQELRDGKMSASSIKALTDMMAEGMERKRRKDMIIAKNAEITPNLVSLSRSGANDVPKQKIIETFESRDNIDELYNPSLLTNIVLIKNNKLYFSQDFSNFSGGMILMEDEVKGSKPDKKDRRIFKNKTKFDFSKDFTMNIFLRMNGDYQNNKFKINIGKGYVLYIEKNRRGEFTLHSPSNYAITEEFGVLKEVKDGSIKSEKRKISDKITYEKNSSEQLIDYSKEIKPNEMIKLMIKKVNTVFTASIDGFDVQLESNVHFFPDKYYLGFNQTNLTKSGTFSPVIITEVIVDKIELEHL